MTGSGPPPVPGVRTEEERERARREREARRAEEAAAQAGGTPSAQPEPADPGGGAGVGRLADGQGSRDPATLAPPADGGSEGTPSSLDTSRASPRGTTGAPARRRPGAPRGRLAAIGLAVGLLVALLATALTLLWPSGGVGHGKVRVVIPAGAGAGEIAELLEERGVVSSALLFKVRATLADRSGELKPGAYTLRRNMGYDAALDALDAGAAPGVINVTLPEGRSRAELAPLVRRAGLTGSYAKASRRSAALDPRDYGAEGARDLEGFLFPSSYELRRGASAKTLVRQQLDAFKREFRRVDLKQTRRLHLTPYEVLTVASMVEREAQVAHERPLIASVIYNRLREGVPLAIDATVRFAADNWTRPLTRSQLASDSPYNTRENQGLPPGPIGNPGLESIRAAAKPARSDFLFYVVKPGTCGEHEFAATLTRFEQARQRYNAERAARGGRSPTDCR